MSLRKLDMLTLFLRCVYRVVSLSLKEAIIKKMDVYFGGTTRADQFKMIFKRIWKHLNVIPHQHKIVLAAPVKGVKDLSTAPQDLQSQSDEHLKFCLRGERIPLQKTSAKWSNLLLYVKPPEPRSHQGQIDQQIHWQAEIVKPSVTEGHRKETVDTRHFDEDGGSVKAPEARWTIYSR